MCCPERPTPQGMVTFRWLDCLACWCLWQGGSYGCRAPEDPEAGPTSQRCFCEGARLTSDASWGFGAFSFSFLLLEISCLMRLPPDTFVLFSFSCELFSCFRGLIGGRGLSSSPLINLSYGRINLQGYQKRGSVRAGSSSSVDAMGVYFLVSPVKTSTW